MKISYGDCGGCTYTPRCPYAIKHVGNNGPVLQLQKYKTDAANHLTGWLPALANNLGVTSPSQQADLACFPALMKFHSLGH